MMPSEPWEAPDIAEQPDADGAYLDVLTWFVVSEGYIAKLRGALGLSANEMNVLLALRIEGPFAISDLADRAQLSRPAMTAMVNRLIERGWVDRGGHEGDRRKVMILLTPRFDRELIAPSMTWRHRVRNHASAIESWASVQQTMEQLAQIARRSANELTAPAVAVIRPAP